MNLAMILEMAADAFGDRIAIGNADDGVSYEGLRRAARAIADRVEDSGAKHLALIEPNGPVVPAALFGAADVPLVKSRTAGRPGDSGNARSDALLASTQFEPAVIDGSMRAMSSCSDASGSR